METKILQKYCKLLGQQIKKMRKKKNITLEELSLKTKIRIEYLAKIEKGNAYGVKLSAHICKIADALGVSVYNLFDFQG